MFNLRAIVFILVTYRGANIFITENFLFLSTNCKYSTVLVELTRVPSINQKSNYIKL